MDSLKNVRNNSQITRQNISIHAHTQKPSHLLCDNLILENCFWHDTMSETYPNYYWRISHLFNFQFKDCNTTSKKVPNTTTCISVLLVTGTSVHEEMDKKFQTNCTAF